MIHLAVPVGANFGWGIAGKSIAKELARLTEITLLTDPFNAETIGDTLEFLALSALLPEGGAPGAGFDQPLRAAGPVLQAVTGVECVPYRPSVRGGVNVGYAFFEDDLLLRRHVQNARRYFDVIAAGSDWCRDALVAAGFANAVTVLQGVDSRLFNPYLNEKEFFADRFVVYSGGKLELRKGQDIVIRAFKALADKHRDVLLISQWFNPWPASLMTMAESKLIRFAWPANDHIACVNHLLAENGVDASRAITLGPQPNSTLAAVFKNTDVGLFPNRCEGGTNLVMNEYMACGKPVIAAFNSGPRDMLKDSNSRRIMNHRPFTVERDGESVARWDEPDLDETIAHLEWAYEHRGGLAELGRRAGEDAGRLTWRHTAEAFLAVIRQAGG